MTKRFPWAEGSVALVGNARSLLNAQFGPEIDSHQWVVRLNQGAFVAGDPLRTGVRTDFIFMTLTGESTLARILFVVRAIRTARRGVVMMSPKARRLLRIDLSRYFSTYPEQWHRELTVEVGSRPSTGLMALDFLTRTMADPSRLHLYGFDFFKTPDIAHGRNNVPSHSPSVEEDYVRALVPPERFHESPLLPHERASDPSSLRKEGKNG